MPRTWNSYAAKKRLLENHALGAHDKRHCPRCPSCNAPEPQTSAFCPKCKQLLIAGHHVGPCRTAQDFVVELREFEPPTNIRIMDHDDNIHAPIPRTVGLSRVDSAWLLREIQTGIFQHVGTRGPSKALSEAVHFCIQYVKRCANAR